MADPPKTRPGRPDQRIHARRLTPGRPAGHLPNPIFERDRVLLASPPLDFAVSDTYFVIAHFHYVLFGTVVFCMFGGFYFWWPSSPEKAQRDPRQVARLDLVHRLPPDIPGAAL